MKRFFALAAAIFAISAGAFAQETVQKTFDFGDFDGIRASFTHHVYVTEGTSDKIEVTCPKKLADYLDYKVVNGVLNLDVNLPNWKRRPLSGNSEIIVSVQMKEINSISLSGCTELDARGNFTGKDLKIKVSGASQICDALNINAKTLDLGISGSSECTIKGSFKKIEGQVSGASELELKGATDELSIECSGASEVDAEEMVAGNVDASASGASEVKVYGNNRLTLKSSGASSIRYYGPAKDLRISDSSISRGR